MYIDDAPTAGSNVIFTNRYSLFVNAGNSYFGGNLLIGTTTNTTDWLNIAASTTAKAQIFLTAGVDPTTPSDGDLWATSTDIKARVAGTTYSLINSGLSGSGAAGQVTFWNSPTNITGSNNLFWDNVNSRLGIGINTPPNQLSVSSSIRTGAHTIHLDGCFGCANNLVLSHDNAVGIIDVNGSAPSCDLLFRTKSVEKMRLFGVTGNLLLQNGGTFTDGGQRLQVTGNAFVSQAIVANGIIQSAGNTTGGGGIFYSNGFGILTETIFSLNTNVSGGATNSSYAVINDTNGLGSLTSATANYLRISSNRNPGLAQIAATGVINFLNLTTVTGSFLSGSSSVTYNAINVDYNINRTGAGTMRGFYYNPTITSLGGSVHNAIETTSGNVLFGSNFIWNNSMTRLGVGTASPTATLEVNGNSIITGNLDVKGSANYINLGTGGFPYYQINSRIVLQEEWTNTMSIGRGYQVIRFSPSNTEVARFDGTNLLIGTIVNSTFKLDVNGTARVSGNMDFGTTAAASTITLPQSSGWTDFTITNFNQANTGIRFRNPTGTRTITIGGANLDITNSTGIITGQILSSQQISIGSISTTTIRGTNTATLDLNGDNMIMHSRTTTASNLRILSGSATATSKGTVYISDYSNLTGTIIPSAQLQVDSTTQGFLPPRMTLAQRTAIATPAEGLIVFQTDGTIGLYVYANATWRSLTMV
jgi:hypothetical protein